MSPRIVYFDLETTGLNYYHDRIIEVAAQTNQGDDPFSELIHLEGAQIPLIVSSLTGINANMLTDCRTERQVLRDFRLYCGTTGEPVYLVAHNAEGFDQWFLRSRFLHHRIRFPSNWRFVDTLQVSRMLFPKRDRYTLKSLCDDFGIPQVNAHRADDDVHCLILVFKRIITIMTRKNTVTSTPELEIEDLWRRTQLHV